MFTPRSFAWCSLSLLSLVSGCSETVNRATPFAFEIPQLVELVCLDPVGEQQDDTGSTRVLPMGCCSPDAPLAPPGSPFARFSDPERPSAAMRPEVCGADPVLHALVTQSVRGEVASVDLVRNRVLDTDELIPGYNFLDVGGLPTGLVAPPHAPGAPNAGPPWTYVASAEENEVRAIATCRFRDREDCGPEEDPDLMRQLSEISSVALPATPADLLLTGNPDPETGELRDQALWVSLPSMGALARISLPRSADADSVSANDLPPFELGTKGPREPQYFGVPTPIPVDPAEFSVDRGYELVCGLGYPYVPQTLERPLAPPAGFEGDVQPTRMRLVHVEDDEATEEDETAELLFVADAALPVVHVFALTAEGGLLARPALPMGAPLKDFAVTALVPATAPDERNVSPDIEVEDPRPRRYLYGIDRRDGSVMAFRLDIGEGGLASVTPLIAPLVGRYSDRLLVGATPPNQFVDTSVGIEIIDTRGLSAAECMPSIPNDEPDAVRGALQDIRDDAGPTQLRGVFVAVLNLLGELAIIDVLDLDLPCRASACADDTELASEDAEAVAVRRHALRLREAAAPDVDITGNNPLVGDPGCDALPVRDEARDEDRMYSYALVGNVCVPPDPWNQLAQTWSIAKGGAIPGLTLSNAVFGVPGDVASELAPGQFVMRAPAGVDLCQRGVMDSAVSARGGDHLLITSAAPEELSDMCPTPSEGAEPTFRIVEAYRDRLVLEPVEEDRVAEAERIQACYPDFFNFQIEAHPDEYLVIGGTSLYLHRMTVGSDGRCVENPDLDPRYTARAVLGEPYVNPYVAFTLSPDWTQRTATVRIAGNREPLIESTFDPTGDFDDALPASVRFFPYVNEVFVVDSARQGLRRYTLTPFEASGETIR